VQHDELVSLMWSLPQFRRLDRAAIAQLCEDGRVLEYPVGAEVYRQGAPGNSAMLVLRGVLIASVEGGGREVVIGECRAGEIVGESALLGREAVRNATVRADRPEPAICLELTQELLGRYSNRAVVVLEQNLVAALTRRVRRTNLAIKHAWREAPAPARPQSAGASLRSLLSNLLGKMP
jgi:CRP-like cAMP-binding protein